MFNGNSVIHSNVQMFVLASLALALSQMINSILLMCDDADLAHAEVLLLLNLIASSLPLAVVLNVLMIQHPVMKHLVHQFEYTNDLLMIDSKIMTFNNYKFMKFNKAVFLLYHMNIPSYFGASRPIPWFVRQLLYRPAIRTRVRKCRNSRSDEL